MVGGTALLRSKLTQLPMPVFQERPDPAGGVAICRCSRILGNSQWPTQRCAAHFGHEARFATLALVYHCVSIGARGLKRVRVHDESTDDVSMSWSPPFHYPYGIEGEMVAQ